MIRDTSQQEPIDGWLRQCEAESKFEREKERERETLKKIKKEESSYLVHSGLSPGQEKVEKKWKTTC